MAYLPRRLALPQIQQRPVTFRLRAQFNVPEGYTIFASLGKCLFVPPRHECLCLGQQTLLDLINRLLPACSRTIFGELDVGQ